MPAITTATTLDLIIKGNTNVPDPLPYGDTYHVSGFPLDELTVYYSIDGGTPVQIGTITEFPADVTGWFSRAAKAGILDSQHRHYHIDRGDLQPVRRYRPVTRLTR